MFGAFFRGAAYVPRGCRDFYFDVKAWKYAFAPLFVLSALYGLGTWKLIDLSRKYGEIVSEKMTSLPHFLSSLTKLVNGFSYVIGIVIALILLATTIGTLYELFGEFFFDSLVEYYEKRKYKIHPNSFTLLSFLVFCLDSLFFAIRTFLVFVFFFVLSLFFPVAGHTLLVIFMGYYTGISYMICSANNGGLRISQMRKLASRKKASVLGFGIVTYLLLMIPFATIFLLPGMVLGGSALYNDIIKEH